MNRKDQLWLADCWVEFGEPSHDDVVKLSFKLSLIHEVFDFKVVSVAVEVGEFDGGIVLPKQLEAHVRDGFIKLDLGQH